MGKPTLLEYALLSASAYNDKGALFEESLNRGWKETTEKTLEDKTGFAAYAYQHDDKKAMVIAIRGTYLTTLTSAIANLSTDLGMVIFPKQKPNTFKFAKAFANQCLDKLPEGYTLSFTGHSLGAALAEFLAYDFYDGFNCSAVTFESPGTGHLIKPESTSDLPKIITLLAAPNLINTCYPHSGNCYRAFIPHVFTLEERVKLLSDALKLAATITRGGASFFQAAGSAAASMSPVASAVPASITIAAGSTLSAKASEASAANLDEYIKKSYAQAAEGALWTYQQHRMDGFVKYLSEGTANNLARIEKWPSRLEMIANNPAAMTLASPIYGKSLMPKSSETRLSPEEVIVALGEAVYKISPVDPRQDEGLRDFFAPAVSRARP